jgi:RNA polymerase sigma-70 factor (sigma-E family)
VSRLSERDREFTEFVTARRATLVRTATLLLAGDSARAEDAVQTALTNLYLAWARVRPEDLNAYARRCVVNAATDEHRSLFHRREQVQAELPELAVDRSGGDEGALSLLTALPAGMRAAVVLRYMEGLSIAETAHAMKCSEGNVKSQSNRGLQRLRELLPAHKHRVG